MPIKSAIIIGGGITGPITALLLAKQGISCSLYELRPAAAIAKLEGAISLAPNTLRLLDNLGFLPALLELGCSVSILEMISLNTGKPSGQFVIGDVKRYGYDSLRMRLRDLQQTLLDAAAKAGVSIHFKKRLIAIEESDIDVTAVFQDGTNITADLLLGCDGTHSSVRTRFIEPSRLPVYTGICAAYGILPASEITAPINFSRSAVMCGRRGYFLATYCDANKTLIYWSTGMEVEKGVSRDGWRAVGADERSTRKRIARQFKDCAIPCLPEMVDKTKEVFFYPIWKLENGGKWSSGRCMLLGDAAHAIPPHRKSQGVGLALEDAVVLSRLLSEKKSTNLAETFAQFEQHRRPRVGVVYNETMKYSKVVRDTGWLRNKVRGWFFQIRFLLFAESTNMNESFDYDVSKMEL